MGNIAAVTSIAAILALALARLPPPLRAERDYEMPEGATSPKYIEFLESNAHIIYPILAVLVLTLMVVGILQAWKAHDLDGLTKAEFKREIIHELRKDVGGQTAENLSRAIGLEPFKLAKLLEEMKRDGLVLSYTNTQRLQVWQLKGVGPNAQKPY